MYYDRGGWRVHGVDNNSRLDFFGPDGDTTLNLRRVKAACRYFEHHDLDIRNRNEMFQLVKGLRPHLIIHCAAQPSHDLAKDRPFDDFEINATSTLTLLEAAREYCRESPFIFMSTNKVYGAAPNELPLVEEQTRWEFARREDWHGISETCRIDATVHSLFGASKLAADILVQEYGRYFNMPTVCLRCGCLTGPNHSSAEGHGFLAYLARCFREGRVYRIFGYKGKQVRDNLLAYDVCRFFSLFFELPRNAAVYNLGGGRSNSISILEAIGRFSDLFGKRVMTEYVEQNRLGDHICYISDLRRLQRDYPSWRPEVSLDQILRQFVHTQGR